MNLAHKQRRTLIVFVGAITLVVLILPAQFSPDNFLQDDSYFYLQVAYNIVKGSGSTFNRITRTNGYHPLWMFCNIVGVALSGGDKLVAIRLVLGMQALLFLGVVLFFVKIADLISMRFWPVGLPLLSVYFLGTGVYGSEAHLNAFMLVAGIYFLVSASFNDDARQWIWAGIFWGLAVLARLDNIFVVGMAFLLRCIVQHEDGIRGLLRRLVLMAIPFSIIVIPYLVLNACSYGHLVPISGSIKSTFPVVTPDIDHLGKVGKGVSLFALLSVPLSFARGTRRTQTLLLRVLGSGVLLHAAYVVAFTDHYTFWPWYYVPGVLNIGFVVPLVLERISLGVEPWFSRRSTDILTALLTILLFASGLARGWIKAYNPDAIGAIRLRNRINEDRWPIEVAYWMKLNLPAQSAVFAYDFPGAIAYYSDLRILPADGLMNDYQYNDDILELGIDQYLCRNSVDLYFGPIGSSEHGTQDVEILAPLSRESAGNIRLLDENLIVRVRDIVASPAGAPAYALWKLEVAKLCCYGPHRLSRAWSTVRMNAERQYLP